MTKKKKEPRPPCQYQFPDGSMCRSFAMQGQVYCAGHANKLGLVKFERKLSPRPVSEDPLGTGIVIPADLLPAPVPLIEVAEPVAMQAVREFTEQEIVRRPVDVEDKMQAILALRQQMELLGITPEEIASVVKVDQDHKVQEARADEDRDQLIAQARALMSNGKQPAEKAAFEAKVMADIQRATTTFAAQTRMTYQQLMREDRVEVFGGLQDEDFNVNGVRVVIPKMKRVRVPLTVARLYEERLLRRQEKTARQQIMLADNQLEYREVQRQMREIDRQFGTTSDADGAMEIAAEEVGRL